MTPEMESAHISANEVGIRFTMNEDLAEKKSIMAEPVFLLE